MKLIITTTNKVFSANAVKSDFDQTVSSLEISREKLLFHMPENLFPNTYICRHNLISIQLVDKLEDSDDTLRGISEEVEGGVEKAKRGRPKKAN